MLWSENLAFAPVERGGPSCWMAMSWWTCIRSIRDTPFEPRAGLGSIGSSILWRESRHCSFLRVVTGWCHGGLTWRDRCISSDESFCNVAMVVIEEFVLPALSPFIQTSFFTSSLPLFRLIKDIFLHRCLELVLVMVNLFLVAKATGFHKKKVDATDY